MKPFIVGLAGGIASGKSAVARLLHAAGAVVLNADTLAHDALRAPDVRDRVVAAFGTGVLAPDGEVDRSRLAAKVFGNPERLGQLESMIHPKVFEAIDRAIGNLGSENGKRAILVIDAPLLFETGLDGLADAVIFVEAPIELREARAAKTRGWAPGEVARRETHQISPEEKRERATWVIENKGTLEELEDRVREILARIG